MLCRHYGLFQDKVSVGLDVQTIELLLNALPKEFADAVRRRLAQRLAEQRAMMSGGD